MQYARSTICTAQRCFFVFPIILSPYGLLVHPFVRLGVRDVVAKTLRQAGIERTRIPSELDIDGCVWLDQTKRMFSLEVVGFAREARAVFRQHDVR